MNVVLQLTLSEYGKHLYKKNTLFTKIIYVWHLVVQRTEEIYRTGCSDTVAMWASGISYSQLVKLPTFSKLHCCISQTLTLRNPETLSICSQELLHCAGTLSHVHIAKGFPTAPVKNNNNNKTGCVENVSLWSSRLTSQKFVAVLRSLSCTPCFFFIYTFDSDVQSIEKGSILHCPCKTLQG